MAQSAPEPGCAPFRTGHLQQPPGVLRAHRLELPFGFEEREDSNLGPHPAVELALAQDVEVA